MEIAKEKLRVAVIHNTKGCCFTLCLTWPIWIAGLGEGNTRTFTWHFFGSFSHNHWTTFAPDLVDLVVELPRVSNSTVSREFRGAQHTRQDGKTDSTESLFTARCTQNENTTQHLLHSLVDWIQFGQNNDDDFRGTESTATNHHHRAEIEWSRLVMMFMRLCPKLKCKTYNIEVQSLLFFNRAENRPRIVVVFVVATTRAFCVSSVPKRYYSVEE